MKKIPDAITLININQYNTGQQSLEKKLEMLIKRLQKSGVKTATVWLQKLVKLRIKFLVLKV